MKKSILIALAFMLIAGQAFAYTITQSAEERFDDTKTGNSYRRVTGYFTLDSSHPAEGELLLPSQLGVASYTKVDIATSGPSAWTTASASNSARNLRRFAFDYSANRFYVVSTGGTGGDGDKFDVSGPITYDLSYLTRVPFEAVGAIS